MADLKQNTKFVYSVSSRKGMIEQLIISIQTLKNYVEPENIIVYYTPPRKDKDLNLIESLGVEVRKRENETPGFSKSDWDEESHYSEKTRVCEVESENAVFLDCDTVILKDIWKVLEGNFDIKARPGNADIPEEKWRELFEENNENYHPWMPNTGFLVFKNGSHHEIAEKWRKYVQEKVKVDYNGPQHEEQNALALAASHKDWEEMTKEEHTFGWAEEPTQDTILLHRKTGSTSEVSIIKQVYNKLEEWS